MPNAFKGAGTMQKNMKKLIGFLAIIMLLTAAGTAWGDDIKARMKSRLPVIMDLKARGVVGENNQGFLQMLKGQTEKKDVVQAENNDRRAIYGHIAKKTSADPQVVGQRRAIQIAEKASPGEWLQDASGKWYQK